MGRPSGEAGIGRQPSRRTCSDTVKAESWCRETTQRTLTRVKLIGLRNEFHFMHGENENEDSNVANFWLATKVAQKHECWVTWCNICLPIYKSKDL